MQKTFTTSDGATITYEERGEGPVLILLHGWSQSAAMFRHQVDHFSRSHRVIAPDFRGHGQSADPGHGYRIYRFAQDIDELMRHAGVERATILGWSMGASVLWGLIDLHGTGRIDRLVFVDEPASVARQPHMDDEAAADAGALFDMATMATAAAQIGGPDGHAARSAFLDGMITKGIDADLEGLPPRREPPRPTGTDRRALRRSLHDRLERDLRPRRPPGAGDRRPGQPRQSALPGMDPTRNSPTPDW